MACFDGRKLLRPGALATGVGDQRGSDYGGKNRDGAGAGVCTVHKKAKVCDAQWKQGPGGALG